MDQSSRAERVSTVRLSPRVLVPVLRQRLHDAPKLPLTTLLRRHWLGLSLLASAALAVYATDAWLLTCGFAGCPTPSEIRAFHPGEGGRIVDEYGHLIGRLAVVRRVNVELRDVPMHVQQAFIATEDRRFYDHNGLDWRGFLRALARNVGSLGVREGFSTITMQVVHNSFLSDRYHGRSLRRELVELRISRLVGRAVAEEPIF